MEQVQHVETLRVREFEHIRLRIRRRHLVGRAARNNLRLIALEPEISRSGLDHMCLRGREAERDQTRSAGVNLRRRNEPRARPLAQSAFLADEHVFQQVASVFSRRQANAGGKQRVNLPAVNELRRMLARAIGYTHDSGAN
ncbi:MAG: hypothetical protein IPK75_19895 [Acidobacteria bacterium]|nr:hypothetical protein [Acidobacteriota bacterium]